MTKNDGPYRSNDISDEPKMSLTDEFIDKLIKTDASDFSYIRNENRWSYGYLGLLYQSELKMFLIEWNYNTIIIEGIPICTNEAQDTRLKVAYGKILNQVTSAAIQNALEQIESEDLK